MNSLLAFDYATTGSDPLRDRPMEFACVRLDMGLNIIGNPTSLHCKPSPDHLPDPAACLLNGITPQFCEKVGLAELAFVNEVHRQLGTPGPIGFGYNSAASTTKLPASCSGGTSSTFTRTSGRTGVADGT